MKWENKNGSSGFFPVFPPDKYYSGVVVEPYPRIKTLINILPGDSVILDALVKNTCDFDVLYFITARWSCPGGKPGVQNPYLPNVLAASIMVKEEVPRTREVLYESSLAELKKKPGKGRYLAPQGEEKLEFCLSLPLNVPARDLNTDITINFDFEAVWA